MRCIESRWGCTGTVDQSEHHQGMLELACDWDKNTIKDMALKIFGHYVARILGQCLGRLWAWLSRKKIGCHESQPLKPCVFADSLRGNVLAEPLLVINCCGEPSISGRASLGK